MAIHAGLGWRNPRKIRRFNRRVTVAAINTQRSHVMLMAERRRLRARDAGVGHVRRALELNAGPEHCGQRKYPRINRGP